MEPSRTPLTNPESPPTGRGARVGTWLQSLPQALLATVAMSLVTIALFWHFALRTIRDRTESPAARYAAADSDRDLLRHLELRQPGGSDSAHFVPAVADDSATAEADSNDAEDLGEGQPAGLESNWPVPPAVADNGPLPTAEGDITAPPMQQEPPTPDAESPPAADKAGSTAAGVRALANPNAPAPERAGRLQVEPMDDGAEPAIRFFGLAATDTKSVVYVIDCSGSMGKPELKLRAAKDELERSIRALDPAQSFSVVFFSDHMYPMPMPGLVAATDANKERICEWIEGAYPRGGTYPLPAVLHALQLRPETIFVLSDGLFKGDYVREIRSNNRGKRRATIYTVGFGDHSGEPQMLRLARENGGSYRFVQPSAR